MLIKKSDMKIKTNQKLLLKIKSKRILEGISQEFIALELGISQNSYHKIESGKTNLKVVTLLKIADILNINYNDLFS